jgi:hypothetical protein
MDKQSRRKVLPKIAYFAVLAAVFLSFGPRLPYMIYATLVASAVAWFTYEFGANKITKHAIWLGIFLLAFDFVIENAGAIAGLWATSGGAIMLGAVPIEIIVLTSVGGTAWAAHLPKKLTKDFVAAEILLFGAFGALGEQILIRNGLMTYTGGWTAMHAFVAYAMTWSILFCLWIKVIRGSKYVG